MLVPSTSESGNLYGVLEGGMAAISFALAFAWPGILSKTFAGIERTFSRLAHKQGLAVLSVGIATFLIRIAILPACPIPRPFLPDDLSQMLAGDTFAHGRLANPTPPMWIHFETIHVDMRPTYMSMYFPAQGLVIAAGKLLFGNPWLGILVCSALMCAAICWMLQAWLPPGWALLGGILAMVRIGLFSYWINTYTGGGLITALGGALVLGALPRLMKTVRFHYGLLMAVGIILLAVTRPYEGLLLCLPVLFVLGRWAFFGKNRPAFSVLLQRAALPVLLIAAAGAWMGYYNYRVFGSPTTLPYTINRATYAMAPYYVWQNQRPEPHYLHDGMKRFYYETEMPLYWGAHSWAHYIPSSLAKVRATFFFFAGALLLSPLVMLRRVLHDRRVRFLVVSVLVLAAGMSIEVYLFPHYVAPFTAAFYAIGLQAMRHLRVWRPEGKLVGLAMVRLTVTLCVVLGAVRVCAAPLGLKVPEWPGTDWSSSWWGPDQYGGERAHIEASLEQLPGKQLVFVKESRTRDPLDQWVYNHADIDGSKVVWAWDMGATNNRELMQFYGDRKAWLVDMGTEPATLSPQPMPTK